ncbi:Unknown protein [Striga hermonthica]|uniref:C2 NT-type domain-containing protein n=1 Tax=Striga hermonthica TaxID=68872 RepID=A0A9N7NL10_STRHE|nr:Unknown protein [Striga hermonthica]
MVLGLKSSKQKRGSFVRAEYIVQVKEIRPWPPSEPLKSIQTVFLHWENGNDNSGSFISVAGHANIAFDESFMLPTTFHHKKSGNKFRNNYLEFRLKEPRKGQLLGTAVFNLTDYASIEEDVNVDVDVPFDFNNTPHTQPALAITLQLLGRGTTSSASSPGVGFFSNDDEDDSDDLSSSHSSTTNASSSFEPFIDDKNGFDTQKDGNKRTQNASLDTWNKVKDYVSLSKFSERSMSFVKKNSAAPLVISSPISVTLPDNERFNSLLNKTHHDTQQTVEDKSKSLHAGSDEQSKLKEKFSEDASGRPVTLRSDTVVPNRKGQGIPPSGSNKARLKHAKSVQIHGSVKGNGFPADTDIPNGSQNKGGDISLPAECKDSKTDVFEWKTRAEMLEEELKETAVIEVALYSVVAEHSSSVNKVHAPARRLSRFYKNACLAGSQAKRARVARAVVSGLVLVSKACGNDVPRLTFWLSNAIMLRSTVSQIAAELPHLNGQRQQQSTPIQESDNCEDVLTMIIALEKIESWLFTRIVDSVWWQTFTPHMLPTVEQGSQRERITRGAKKAINGRRNYLGDQGSFSIEIWKKAFKDACERLCPIRAVRHECGCLSALITLVMEQLVNRLDVAMLNAILRESDEEMPMDPVSDPITYSKVLPVPAGKSSFGAGAQLKNAIRNWSRWLSDLFGLDDDDELSEDKRTKCFKAFRLLHGLSDLMMLPFEMLADISTRKEVCPMFGPAIIRRVVDNFVPDEFSPNPIPRHITDALDLEENISEELISSIPCTAGGTKYIPLPAAVVIRCLGEVGKQSSRLWSHTSNDEVDEVDEVESPLTSIIPDSHHPTSALARLNLMPKEKIMRYQLLRAIYEN